MNAADVPTELPHVVWTLHRVLLQAKRPPAGEKMRPQAQVELMQLVFDQPGINVQRAAQSLRMQPRNVSTLVTKLVADGLIARIAEPDNRRCVQLHPTPKMHEGSHQVDASLQDDIATALAAMPSECEAQIAAALPALRDLAQRLSRSTPPERPRTD